MGNAVVTTQVVPSGAAGDIAAQAAALDGQAGIDAAVVDPGLDLVVSADLTATDAGTKNVWNVDDGDAASGDFALQVDGVQTADIPASSAAAVVETALEALSNVVAVTVTGTGAIADPYVITFDDPVGPRVVTFVDVDLVGATSPGATEATPGVAPDASVAQAEVDAAIAAVGGVQEFSESVVVDPVLDSPADVALDISDAGTVRVTWQVTLSGRAKIASIAVEAAELTALSVPVRIEGNPQGHESQKNSENKVHVILGPASAGSEVGSPHNLSLSVVDTNGRTSLTDNVQVTIAA